MKVIGIIPSRYQSSRFPGKPLINLDGKTMIHRVYENAKKSSSLNELVVATDDRRIFDEVKSFDGNVLMTASTHQTGSERCGEVLGKYSGYDVVINIQGDEPLLDARQIDLLVSLFADDKVEIGTLVKKITSTEDITNPNRVKVILDNYRNAIYFSRSSVPFVLLSSNQDGIKKQTFYKHIGIYAWRSATLKKLLALPVTELEKAESLEQLRWIYYGYNIRTAETVIETPNVDVPADVEKVLTCLRTG